MHFLKATLIGGVAFLVPIVVLLMVLGKAFELMSRLAAPVQRFVPLESIGGIAVADLVAVLAMVLVCLLAGLFAMSRPGTTGLTVLGGADIATQDTPS